MSNSIEKSKLLLLKVVPIPDQSSLEESDSCQYDDVTARFIRQQRISIAHPLETLL
jgi:hypothetical protein